jgi:hypothetical protein
VVPEVIEEEIKKHTYKRGKEAVSSIRDNFRLIEQLMGSRNDYRVPSDTDFVSRVESRLAELGGLICRKNFTLNQARGALKRVFEETPPNGYKNQQFKDSVIWETILEVAENYDVDFVTEDKAFFKDSKPQNVLASNLLEDASLVLGKIRVFYKLQNYLDETRAETPPLDKDRISKEINSALSQDLHEKAVDKGYTLNWLFRSKVDVFLTEQPDIAAVDFELSYLVSDVAIPDTEDVVEADLIVKGSCGCNVISYGVADLYLESIKISTKDGEQIPTYGTVNLKGTVHFGRRDIPYQFKELLD